MKKKEPSVKRQLSPVVAILMFLTLLGIGVCGMSPLLEELKAGKAYTLGVIFDNVTRVDESDSPASFWFNMAWQLFGCGGGIVLGVVGLFQVFINRKPQQGND